MDKNFSTKAIHQQEKPNLSQQTSSDVVTPIHLSSTFAKLDFETNATNHSYSRISNPTREVIEEKLRCLENAKYTIAYASGQAAECIAVLSFLKSGDEILCFDDIYGGTRRILGDVFNNFGITTKFIDLKDLEVIKQNITSKTKLIWLESPTNPFLTLCDIEAISSLAKEKGILTLVDNTFATPYLQRPLDLGADISLHSMTKYISGHSDTIAGAICVNSDELYEKLRFVSNSCGAVLSPFDSYLNARGIKTLSIRMQKHCENALEVAKFLESNKKVSKVYYPGLESFPQHSLAKKQMKNGFGGVVSVAFKADYEGMKRFAKEIELFSLAESLGGVESLYGMPFYMSHGSVPPSVKEKMNITKDLLRLSIGIEDCNDLIKDLEKAISKI